MQDHRKKELGTSKWPRLPATDPDTTLYLATERDKKSNRRQLKSDRSLIKRLLKRAE